MIESSAVRGTRTDPSTGLKTPKLEFTAVTMTVSPTAPTVSEGKNPSRSARASNPKNVSGAAVFGDAAIRGSRTDGRDRWEATSNEVGRCWAGPAGPA